MIFTRKKCGIFPLLYVSLPEGGYLPNQPTAQPTNIAGIFAWRCFFGTPFPFIPDHQPRFMMKKTPKNYHTNFTHKHTPLSTLLPFFPWFFFPLSSIQYVFSYSCFFLVRISNPLESRLCPIFKAIVAGFRGFQLPKKIGHLAFQAPKNPHKNHTKFHSNPAPVRGLATQEVTVRRIKLQMATFVDLGIAEIRGTTPPRRGGNKKNRWSNVRKP